MKGSAFATVLAQLATCLWVMSYFLERAQFGEVSLEEFASQTVCAVAKASWL